MDSLNQSMPRLERALAIIPDDPMGNYYMGTVLNQLKRPNEALRYLQNALRIRSKWISAMNALAGVYDSMKQYAASDSMYKAALQIEPDNPLLLNNWSYSLSERNESLNDAFNMSIKALEKDPENGAYLDTLGWIYFKMGNFQKAKELIERAYRTRQSSSDILDHLGEVYVHLGMKAQALEMWKKALELDPGNAGIQHKISQASGEAR
jgi:tetratricopeptide (TPR) repeat protein